MLGTWKWMLWLILLWLIIFSCQPNKNQSLIQEEIWISHMNPNPIHVEPHLAFHPKDNNRLVVASMFWEGDQKNPGLIIYFSKNGGRAWQEVFQSESTNFVGDPWVNYLPNGEILVHCLNLKRKGGVTFLHSKDDGKKWTITDGLPTFEMKAYDHPAATISSKNRILISASQVKSVKNTSTSGARITQLNSKLEMLNSHYYEKDFTDFTAGNPSCFSDGTIIFPFVEIATTIKGYQEILDTPRTFVQILSEDFSKKSEALLVTQNNGLGSFPVLTVDHYDDSPFTDHVYLTRHIAKLSHRTVHFWRSINKGKNWEKINLPKPSSVDIDQKYSTVIVNPQGIVLVAWYEIDSSNCMDLYYCYSLDGGKDFSPKQKINSNISCNESPVHQNLILKNGRPILDRYPTAGDYFGLATNTSGTFCFAYPISINGIFQLRFKCIQINHSQK